jgi:hypothetical protein
LTAENGGFAPGQWGVPYLSMILALEDIGPGDGAASHGRY